MTNIMMINPEASPADLQDMITMRLFQAKALSLVMNDHEDAFNSWDIETKSNYYCALQDIIQECHDLVDAQWEKIRAEKLEVSPHMLSEMKKILSSATPRQN